MDHQPGGLYRLLERPGFYERFQRLLGAAAARRRFVAEMLRPWTGASLLDIGCGTGSLLRYLPSEVEYTGFDSNSRYIDAAREAFGGRARFLVARAGEEPAELKIGTFDFVVAKAVLHHLDDREAEAMLHHARRLLRKGGVFVAIDPVVHEGQHPISRLLVSVDRGRHVRSAGGYRELVKSQFDLLEARVITDLLPLPYSHHLIRATSRK